MIKKSITLIVCLMFLAGCATPGKLYPNFVQQNKALKKVTVFLDVSFMKDGMEQGMIMDVDQNVDLLELLAGQIRKELPVKGYTVNGLYALAGTIMVNSNTMPVEIRGSKGDDIPYADKAFHESGISLEDLRTALWALVQAGNKKKPEQENSVVHEVASLKSPEDPDAYIFVRSGGVQVGFMKQMGQAFGSALATAGFMYGYSVGQITTYLYVVDASTGELLWEDSFTQQSSSSTSWAVADEIRGIIKRFPAR